MQRTALQHLGKGILTSVKNPPGDLSAHRPTAPLRPASPWGLFSGSMHALRPFSHCALGWVFPMGVEVLGGIT